MNKPLKNICLASGVALAFGAQADTFDVTATVDNAITLVETTPFTLGSIYILAETDAVVSSNSNSATITIDADGDATTDATNANTSAIVSLGGSVAGLLSITGAAAFTSITVTPGTDSDLAHSSGSPAVPDILVDDIVVYDADDTSSSASASASATISVVTDGSGNADIIVGGVFMADASTASDDYESGTYTGSYTVDVAY